MSKGGNHAYLRYPMPQLQTSISKFGTRQYQSTQRVGVFTMRLTRGETDFSTTQPTSIGTNARRGLSLLRWLINSSTNGKNNKMYSFRVFRAFRGQQLGV